MNKMRSLQDEMTSTTSEHENSVNDCLNTSSKRSARTSLGGVTSSRNKNNVRRSISGNDESMLNSSASSRSLLRDGDEMY